MSASPAHKQQFYSEMAKLLEAGFGIRQAADVMSGSGLPPSLSRLIHALTHGLDGGKTIAAALTDGVQGITELERAIISAGERGGRLAPALLHLSDYYGMLASAHREALKSLVHPVLVLHLGVFIGTVPTAMVTGAESMAQAMGSFFITLFIVYLLTFLAFLAIRALLRSARTNPRTDRTIRRIPLIGRTRNDMAMAGFCKVYHTCLLAGLPMMETLRMAVDASQSGMIRDAGSRLRNTLAEGRPLGPVMTAEPVFPKPFARSYSTGEAAGTLDKDLANWSITFQNNARSGVKTLAAALPRILYLMILAYVAWKIVGFFNNYYGSLLKELE